VKMCVCLLSCLLFLSFSVSVSLTVSLSRFLCLSLFFFVSLFLARTLSLFVSRSLFLFLSLYLSFSPSLSLFLSVSSSLPTTEEYQVCRLRPCAGAVAACRLRPCAGAVAEGAWEKPRRPHHASLQPVPARRKSGARRACLAPDRDTLCTRTGGDARGHAAHEHGGASSVQERGRRGWVPTVCWWWRGGAQAEASRRSVPRLLCFVIDVARRGCVS